MPIINSVISAGKVPTGTKPITSNGMHDVAGYANADVQVPTTAPDYYINMNVNNGQLTFGNDIINSFNGINEIKADGFGNRFYSNKTFSNQNYILNFNGIITGDYVFQYMFANTNIKKVDLSGITCIEGGNVFTGAFSGCSQLEEVDISRLERIGNPNVLCASETFQFAFGNNNMTEFSFSGLKYLYGNINQTFSSIYNSTFTTVRFPLLEECHTGGDSWNDYSCFTFFCNNNVRDIYFNSFKSNTFGGKINCFNNMFTASNNGCTLHFPSNLDPQNGSIIISNLTGYPNFGGTNTILAFDLPATE